MLKFNNNLPLYFTGTLDHHKQKSFKPSPCSESETIFINYFMKYRESDTYILRFSVVRVVFVFGLDRIEIGGVGSQPLRDVELMESSSLVRLVDGVTSVVEVGTFP